MPSLKVCLSPNLINLFELKGNTVVVVDILRATSCITTALGCGIKSIKPVSNLEECLALSNEGYITAGERNGKKVDGFDLGNSPFGFMDEKLQGKKIAFTTTNGTQAINLSERADLVIAGSFLNIAAIKDFLYNQASHVTIVCAGWKGMINLEDTLFAGALADELSNDFNVDEDATLASIYLFRKAQNNLFKFLQNSSHFNRLSKLNIVDDIKYCLKFNEFEVVPVLKNSELVLLES